MTLRSARTIAVLAAAAAFGLGGAVPAAFARHGSDDPITHDARDDHGGARAHDARDDHGGRRHHHRHHDDGRRGDDR
jgi:hypothetical protein